MARNEILSIHFNFNPKTKEAGQVVAFSIRPQKLGDGALLEIINHQKYHAGERLIKLTFGDKYSNQRPVRVTSSELREYDFLPQEEKETKMGYLLNLMRYAKLITVREICTVDNQLQYALNPSKYSLTIKGDNIVETFQTEQLSEEELKRLLKKQAEDTSPKKITLINEFSNISVFEIDPNTDEELIEEARRADTIIIEHNVFAQTNHEK